MRKISNFLLKSSIRLKSLDVAVKNETIAKLNVSHIEAFQKNIEILKNELLHLFNLKNIPIKRIEIQEMPNLRPYFNIGAKITIYFEKNFDEDFIHEFDKEAKSIFQKFNSYKFSTLDNNNQDKIFIEIESQLNNWIPWN